MSDSTADASPEPGTRHARMPNRLVAVGLALVVGLPFLNKPFHIDDPVVLSVAGQILETPLRPFAGEINWANDPAPMFRQTTNPPLLSYYLAPFIAAFGYSEVALHAAMLLFLAMLSVAGLSLSRRFAGGSWWPVLFVMLSPAVVVSGNVMRDVPATALAAAAVATFVVGADKERRGLLVAGSLLAGCAMLTKYSAAILFPVLFVYLLLSGRARHWWTLLPGLGLPALWCVQNVWAHGTMHLTYLMAEKRSGFAWQEHFCAGLAIVGACCFLAPAALVGTLASRSWWRALLYAPGAALVYVAVHGHFGESLDWQRLLWSELGGVLLWAVAAGVLVFRGDRLSQETGQPFRIAHPALRTLTGDDAFLALWGGLVLVFSVKFVMFQAVRHVLPAMVPLCLLGVRLTQSARPVRSVASLALGICLAAQALVAFRLGAADAAFAETHRDYCRRVPTVIDSAAGEVWFSGHWGWQHYALAAGWRQLATGGPLPAAGDLLVMPERVAKGRLPEGLLGRLESISERAYRTRNRLFTMDGFEDAGFYATVGGTLPFACKPRGEMLESIRIFRVNAANRSEPRP